MFDKILIANRGEIACRVIKTARKMGVLTVAVYSDADKKALHTQLADEAVYIGESPASESYLVGNKILDAAKRTGAQAIHPGYGFLSENADFCRQCVDEGIVFIGPPADAIAEMGSKSAAKTIMESAGVPLIPGYHGDDQQPEILKSIADDMGYPILLKATAGGGGRGMRPVENSDQFFSALNEAKREANSSFGDDKMLIEKYLARPRHVEVQVFCDQQGNGVYLGDRDCSIQRRHQKVIEEAPAPDLPVALRKSMGEAAVRAAQAINYVGAGTIEFLVDKNADGQWRFYFMEMNTRLQVEHPVTEKITGLDLVAWQIRVAAGEPLPKQQEDIVLSGHAIEARIYAEDPSQNFCPSTGTLIHLRPPQENDNVRVDTGVVEGDAVSPFYDPMISKLVVWDTEREPARKRLINALGDYQIAGVTTNIGLLDRIISSNAFKDAELDTHFIETNKDEILKTDDIHLHNNIALASLYLLLRRKQRQMSFYEQDELDSAWSSADSWRLNQPRIHRGNITINNLSYAIEAEEVHQALHTSYLLSFDGAQYEVSGLLESTALLADINGLRVTVNIVDHGPHTSTLMTRHGNIEFQLDQPDTGLDESGQASGGCLAPMNGRILDVLVVPGQNVTKGTELVVMEAMKMEHTVTSPVDGVVENIYCESGELVDGGSELVHIVAEEGEE